MQTQQPKTQAGPNIDGLLLSTTCFSAKKKNKCSKKKKKLLTSLVYLITNKEQGKFIRKTQNRTDTKYRKLKTQEPLVKNC